MKSLPGIQFDFILICKDIWTVFCWCFIPLFSRMCRMRTTHERNRSERKLFTVCFHIAMVVAGMEFVDLALCCRCICRRLCDISTRHTQTYSHHLVNTLLPKPPMDIYIYIYWWKLMNWLQSSIDNDIESPAHASMQSKPMIKKKQNQQKYLHQPIDIVSMTYERIKCAEILTFANQQPAPILYTIISYQVKWWIFISYFLLYSVHTHKMTVRS